MLYPLLLATLALAASPTDWNALFDQGDSAKVHFGAVLGGTEPFARNNTETFAPASTQKLFTAGALLAQLGPDYRYPTTLRWSEEATGVATALTLVGSGDPSWALEEHGETLSDRFNLIAAGLKKAGVVTVQGDIAAIAADVRWNSVITPEGWTGGDATTCDGALAQAFNLALNCAKISVTSPTKAEWESAGLTYPVHLAIKAGTTTNLDVVKGTGAFTITGTWKSGTTAVSFSLPIDDTRPWTEALFKQALLAEGIKFVPGPRRAVGAAKQLVFFSPALSDLVKPFLKNSINVMGDAFLKSLASQATTGGPGLLDPGLASLNKFLATFGDTRDLLLHDGSGLSRTSRVTPAFLYGYLERISSETWFPAIWAALPIAGVDGTLKTRMKGTPAEGVLRGKTGTLDGVYNLAGYVPQGNRFVPYVIYTRTTSNLSTPAKASADRVGIRLVQLYSDVEATPQAAPAPFPFVPEHAGIDAPL